MEDPNYIYVLKMSGVLPGGPRYYIGKTKHVQTRLQQHQTGTSGVEYVKFHYDHGGTIVLEEKFLEQHALHEEHLTELYMYKHGINYVRGGTRTHCNIIIDSMVDRFRSADDLCYMCGDGNHRSSSCPFRGLRKVKSSRAHVHVLSSVPPTDHILLRFVLPDFVCVCQLFRIPLQYEETLQNAKNFHVTKKKKVYQMASAPAYWHNQNCSVTIHETLLRVHSIGLAKCFILDLGSVQYIFLIERTEVFDASQKKSVRLEYKRIGP